MLWTEPGHKYPTQKAPGGNGNMGLPWMVVTCCVFPKLSGNLGGEHPCSVFLGRRGKNFREVAPHMFTM